MIEEIHEHIKVAQEVVALESQILEISQALIDALDSGKKILIFGNGGSAGDAQHFSAELTGRYKAERRGLPAIALTTDSSALTAIGNDYGFDAIFSRQIQALAQEGDICFGISTSGNSKNVLNGFQEGRKKGCRCIGLGGRDGGKMRAYCDLHLIVPSDHTARIQEMHILIIHLLCDAIDRAFL